MPEKLLIALARLKHPLNEQRLCPREASDLIVSKYLFAKRLCCNSLKPAPRRNVNCSDGCKEFLRFGDKRCFIGKSPQPSRHRPRSTCALFCNQNPHLTRIKCVISY